MLRDIRQRLAGRLNQKQNQKPRFRAVLCAGDGSRTSGSVYASDNHKRVWFQFFGSGGIGRARCEKIVPELGLGVYVSQTDDGLEWQVLEDDPLLRLSATDPRDYQSIGQNDLNPGGRLLLWVDSRQLEPLATWDTPDSLLVNVNTGYYLYGTSRKLFPGEIDIDLTASVPGSASQWRYVGLYLDSANSLQIVDGTAVSTALTPPEPSWPAGAFRLAVILLENGQTKIDFANDVFDRRLVWSDENGSGGWPFTDTLTVDPTDPDADYSTLAAGVAGISAGQRLLIGSNLTGTSGIAIGAAIGLIGTAQNVTIAGDGHQAILTIIAAALLENLSLSNSYNSGTIYCINLAANATFRNVSFSINSGNTGGRRGLQAAACSPDLYDCEIDITSVSGQTAEGIYAQTSGTIDVYGGRINVSGPGTNYAVYADTGTIIQLHGVTIESGSIGGAGTVTGHYYDAAGNLITLDNTSQSAGVWLIDESAGLRTKYATLSAAVTAAATGDKIKLFAGTYTITGSALSLSKTIEVEGDGVGVTVITSSLSNSPTIDVTADNVTFRNLTIQHTGTGSIAGPLSTDNTGMVLDNVYLDKTSGASTTSYGLWMYGGSVTLKNGTLISCTAGTTKYGIYNDTADATITIFGGQVGGDTQDIYGSQAGSTLTLIGPVLTNRLISWSGAGNGHYSYAGKIYGVGISRPASNTNVVLQYASVSDSDFTSTIATLPGGANLTYGAVTTGAANNLVPVSSSQLAKTVLHNTTRGTSALISTANTGTSTITLTANVPTGWQVGDTITIRSQTNTNNPSGGARYIDFEFTSGLNLGTSKIMVALAYSDTGAPPAVMFIHPFEANSNPKRFAIRTWLTGITNVSTTPEMDLISNRFCVAWDATGSATATVSISIYEADGL